MNETAKPDRAARILLGIAIFLIFLNLTATVLIRSRGHAYFWLLEFSMALTAAFAVAGAAIGLMRGLRSGRAARKPNA